MQAHELNEIVSTLRSHLPQAQAQTGARGAAPAVADEHLTAVATHFVVPALRAFDDATGHGAAAAPDPDKKAKRKAFLDALIQGLVKNLPALIAIFGGLSGAQTAPEAT